MRGVLALQWYKYCVRIDRKVHWFRQQGLYTWRCSFCSIGDGYYYIDQARAAQDALAHVCNVGLRYQAERKVQQCLLMTPADQA